MTIDELQLEPIADHGARLLQQKHPNIEFTSGRRTIAQQAHAMAANIVSLPDRQFIGRTYLAGAKLQEWVDAHPAAVTVDAIKADIRALPGLNKFLEKEAGHVRWHAQFQ